MRPGAGRALDAVRSSLCLCLVVLLHWTEAAGYEGAVYNGECGLCFWAMATMGFLYIVEQLDEAKNAWECVSV